MKGFRFLRQARAEMTEAAERYEGERTGLGGEFLDEVHRVVDAARLHPESGTPLIRGTRRLLLRRFPYSLVFRDEPENILIVAVAHHRRRSGYWLRRK
ncbi:MAG TPA: type II toxin-antitoxin system RelE/ParE family toxin [Longimicrobiaceae bacterium]